jgi:hypothetical protein
MIASDSTENIQALRANLHAATLGLVTPAVDQDQQSIDDSTRDRQRPRRRYMKKSSSNKKKVRREKRIRKHKRSRHKKVRSPDQGDDSSLSSDSLSSSSSSEINYTSSSDDSCRSILDFGDHGSKTNIRDIKNDKGHHLSWCSQSQRNLMTTSCLMTSWSRLLDQVSGLSCVGSVCVS